MSPRDFWMSGWMLQIESFKWVFWSRFNGLCGGDGNIYDKSQKYQERGMKNH